MENETNNIVLVTVASFPEAIEAHIYRSRLEAEGIPCVTADENIVSNQPWHTIAYGGVKLRVRQTDETRAREIIQEIRGKLHTEAPERCPVCHSDKIKVKRNVNVIKQVVSVLFMGTPVAKKAACINCGHTWQLS
ncbi:MAG: hypothetical protein COW65_14950 [Cytophagales bacterium CG18_big_fil_WC_8_21_14_2_50_42_9]|nr:MAG: hypothetical protein COW65_14950 [Cytophagales bacterium CG18_big_fil_WC_8_21_14_2_50_42_9]